MQYPFSQGRWPLFVHCLYSQHHIFSFVFVTSLLHMPMFLVRSQKLIKKSTICVCVYIYIVEYRKWILFCREIEWYDNVRVSSWLSKGHIVTETLRLCHKKTWCQLYEIQGKAYFEKSNQVLQRSGAGAIWNIFKSPCHWKIVRMWESR